MGVKKSFCLYFVGNVATKAIAFILVPIYISSMSTAQYGIVGSMQVLINVLAILFSLGTERSIYRLYHDYKTNKEKLEYLGSVTWFIYLFALLSLGLCILFKGVVSQIYISIPFAPYYLFAFGIAFFNIFSVTPLIYLQTSEQPAKYVIISLLQVLLNSVGILYFAVYKQEGAYGMLLGQMLAALGMLPIYLWYQFKVFIPVIKTSYVKSTLKYSLPLLPCLIGAWIINLSSQIFIEHNFSTSEVAIYALSQKLVAFVSIVYGSLSVAYNPIYYKWANSEDQVSAKIYLTKLQNSITILSIFATATVAIFAKDIIYLFFPQDYADASLIISILILGTIFAQISGFVNLSFYQSKKTKEIMYLSLIYAAVTIALNGLLIPRYSYYGAAWTYAICAALFFVIYYLYSKKYYFVPYRWTQILAAFIIVIGLTIINNLFLHTGWLISALKEGVYLGIVYLYYKRNRKLFSR